MFELKYKITDADVKAVNKSIMWVYFFPYVAASLVGIAVGIVATILRPRTEMLVLGIVLIILGAILLVCALLLLIAPKNFVASALLTDDNTERTVKFTDDNITISTADKSDIIVDYCEITKLKFKKSHILAYVGKEQVLIIKDAILSGQTLEELFGFVNARLNKLTVSPAAKAGSTSASAENTEKSENVETAAPTETPAETPAEAVDKEDGDASSNK